MIKEFEGILQNLEDILKDEEISLSNSESSEQKQYRQGIVDGIIQCIDSIHEEEQAIIDDAEY